MDLKEKIKKIKKGEVLRLEGTQKNLEDVQDFFEQKFLYIDELGNFCCLYKDGKIAYYFEDEDNVIIIENV